MLFSVSPEQIQRNKRALKKRKRSSGNVSSVVLFLTATTRACALLALLPSQLSFGLILPSSSTSTSLHPCFGGGMVEAFDLRVAPTRRPALSHNLNSLFRDKGKSPDHNKRDLSRLLAQYADNRDSDNHQYDRREQRQQTQQQKSWSSRHQSSTTNSRRRRRRRPKTEHGNRTQQQQLQWILNTVMATQQRQREWNNNKHAERRRKAAMVIVSDDLVLALKRLVRAKTTNQVSEAGRQLETAIDLIWQEQQQQQDKSRLFWEIQERLVKATSMTGLLNLSLNIANRMLQASHLPSSMAQDALCSSLRRAGKLERLQELILQLGAVAITQHQQQQDGDQPVREEVDCELPARGVSLSAFNSYLAAMCDVVTEKRNRRNSQSSSQRSVFGNEKNSATLLEECWRWISSSSSSSSSSADVASFVELGVDPDDVSFATVLQAASSIGNETLTYLLWDDMHRRHIQPNIVAYNARLRMAIKSSSQTLVERDENVLAIWKDEIQKDPNVQPDRYTIDLLLLPLTRQGRIGQVQDLLDDFILEHRGYSDGSSGAQRQQEGVVSSAFSSYFKTLVQGGEVSMAQNLFDTYILPVIRSPVLVDPNAEQTQLVVHPTTRHFNVLLSGYRGLLQQQQEQERKQSEANDNDSVGAIERSDGTDIQKCAYADGWRLFKLMQNHPSPGIHPDAFTFTSMMGLCSTPSELSSLLHLAVNRYGVYCASAVLRAAMTTFGEMGDASSACWLFAEFACPISLAPPPVSYNQRMECQPASLREWNVLLGALARSAEQNATHPINVGGAQVAQTMSTSTYPVDVPTSSTSTSATINRPFTLLVNQSTCSAAAGVILDAMTAENALTAETTNIAFRLPKPNSQSYCLVATALQHSVESTISNTTTAKSDEALALFNKAMEAGVPADGRFLNAIFRCFGPDIKAAIQAWKTQIRPACLAHENRRRMRPPSARRKQGKNLVAAYHGLLYCCGRAQRADMALRIVYAMTKEGLETSETALNVYQAGKRLQNELNQEEGTVGKRSSLLARKLRLIDPYESLLYVECTKYNRADQRRAGEKRLRIIV